MYSVVLMMALTSGGDVSALGNKCCGGCSGCYGCSGCCGGKHSRHSCCGGCYGCCGGNYSCCGGKHSRKSCHGCCGSYYGCGGGCYGGMGVGCYGGMGVGCYGGMGVGTPVVPNVAPATGTQKQTMENSAPATLIVTVPAEARLSIDGEATTSTSTERVFVSPALNFGREYHYTVQAEFKKDGKLVKVSKDVAISAGNETRVNFAAENMADVASR